MILAILLTSVLMWSCQPVDGDHILGKDLAAAHPAFAAIAPDRVIGATPAPGVERVLHSDEVARIARDNNIDISAPAPELCFVRATEPLTADRLLPVLQKALELDAAKIEILDFIRFPVPPGALEFTRAGLSPNGLWRGSVMYAPGRSMQLWAKVSVSTVQTWIEAAVPITPGKTIAADQLILRTGPRFPFGAAPVDSIDFVAARQAVRSIRPGEPIFASMLAVPRDVERGDSITVHVVVGQTELSFSAVAESSGRAGESVLIRNPENGKFFQARIESKGKVLVTK
jgi:flagella basal body P-ring formation protein FlgA